MKHATCIICRELYCEESPPILVTKCGHSFHEECLLEWIKYRGNPCWGNCPFCRQNITFSDCVCCHFVFDSDDGIQTPQEDGKQTGEGGARDSHILAKRFLELDKMEDPKMNSFSDIMHTILLILFTLVFIYFGCWLTTEEFLRLETEGRDTGDEEYIRTELEFISFGNPWVLIMAICSMAGILFGYWATYMHQENIGSFGRYLWVCMAPRRLQSLF